MNTKLLGGAFLLLAATAACSNPNGPSLTPRVEQRGELSITCDVSVCTFVGTAANTGNGPASGVSGVTAFTVGEKTTSEVRVAITPEIPAGATATFSGVVLKTVLVESSGHWRTHTDFSWCAPSR